MLRSPHAHHGSSQLLCCADSVCAIITHWIETHRMHIEQSSMLTPATAWHYPT